MERCLKAIRESNSGTLLGLDLDTITAKVKDQLKLRVKNTNSLSTVKYSGPAWGTVKEENIDWNKNEHEDYDCVICFEKLTEINYIQLACKHEFHETVSVFHGLVIIFRIVNANKLHLLFLTVH